jgi:hypothetical protein
MTFIFTQLYVRYVFVSLAAFFVLGFLGIEDVIGGVRRLLGTVHDDMLQQQSLARGRQLALVALLLAVALSTVPNVESLGLAASRITRSPAQIGQVDYDYVAHYVKVHEQPGDIVITHAAPNIPAEYLGRPPDYVVQPRLGQRLLYIFEKDGRAVDTQYGVPVLLGADDLLHLLEGHHRAWLFTDAKHSLQLLPPGFRDIIVQRFALVCVGVTAQAYLYSG